MNLFVFGKGGAAKDIVGIVDAVNQVDQAHLKMAGFIDLEESELKVGHSIYPVFKEESFFQADHSENFFAIGIGDPGRLQYISEKFTHLNFLNLIHPSVTFHAQSVTFGRGNVVPAGCAFSTCISVGNFNYFGANVTVGHDTSIEDFNVLNPGSVISGNSRLRSAMIGANATVLQGLKLADNITIGAGALVTKDLTQSGKYIGVPAKLMESL